ncbi:hypothetical protein ACS5PJ_15150 [Pseudarthrobacter sp. YS3]|uniref:hypothetical protein n=1 Tax=Pseudarthrobacter sp. YS3 TaxID=3453718 RepID=UPI003EEA9279
MKQEAMYRWLSCVMGAIILAGCTTPSKENGSEPVAVENRVKVGETNWVVEYGNGRDVADSGTIESFEIVNNTDADIRVPDAGLNNTAFRIILNNCANVILKPGRSCILRGEWGTGNTREATLNVAVSKQNGENAATESISVPLGAAEGSHAPPTSKTVSPTPSPSSTTSPSPSGTATTGTPTPTPSTTSGSPGQKPSVAPTFGGSTGK